jgi:formimidoylglutamate deiminase
MFALVDRLDPDAFFEHSQRAFEEMLDAGITTVGEFHYLRHGVDGDRFAFDTVVLDAAAQAGIRLVLLNTYYNQGGIGEPLQAAQHRFGCTDPAEYLIQVDRLGKALRPNQSLGMVAHSIRAATLEDIASLQQEALRRQLPFHIHVEEQRREIAEAVAAYGRPPMEILNDILPDRSNVTAVHCTHTRHDDLRDFVDGGGRVCVCPLTEGNLGDGIPDAPNLHGLKPHLSLGTDSNVRISMTEEMRWLEYGQRLSIETRGVIRDEGGSSAGALLDIATRHGGEALGISAGTLTKGAFADFTAVNLDAVSLQGVDEPLLLDALVFGSGNDAIAGTFVSGRWRASRSA